MAVGWCGCILVSTKARTDAARMREVKGKSASVHAVKERRRESATTPPPLAQRSNLGRKLAAGEFVALVDIVPPKGIDFRNAVEGAKYLKAAAIDAIYIPHSPRPSRRLRNLALRTLVPPRAGIATALHST